MSYRLNELPASAAAAEAQHAQQAKDGEDEGRRFGDGFEEVDVKIPVATAIRTDLIESRVRVIVKLATRITTSVKKVGAAITGVIDEFGLDGVQSIGIEADGDRRCKGDVVVAVKRAAYKAGLTVEGRRGLGVGTRRDLKHPNVPIDVNCGTAGLHLECEIRKRVAAGKGTGRELLSFVLPPTVVATAGEGFIPAVDGRRGGAEANSGRIGQGGGEDNGTHRHDGEGQ